MNAHTRIERPGRRLALGALLALGLALLSLTQVRQADAQVPPFTLYLPELTVASAEVKYLGGPFFVPGYYLVFVVKNVGNADAGPFTVAVRDYYSGSTLESWSMTGMKAGGGRMFWHKLPTPGDCMVAVLRIVADSTYQIFEINEKNNTWVVNEGYGPCSGPD
jgi:CARDB